MPQIERVGVCGLGKVGSVLHRVMSEVLPTYGYDIDGTGDVTNLVRDTDACIFIVPTPSLPDGTFSNEHLTDAITAVAREVALQAKTKYVFIVSSTTTPGSCEKELLPLIPTGCGLVYKPEFIAQGRIEEDMKNPDFVLIGENESWAGWAVANLYERVAKAAPIHRMSLTEAELAKISVNCAVTMKISFANQVGMLAEEMGCDPHKILAAVGSDKRIGRQYLHYGLPYGGPCFPRDNRMFRAVALRNGITPYLAGATDKTNRQLKERLLDVLGGESGTVGILGLTYKPGTGITEESLGMSLYECLPSVLAHDPVAHSPNTLEEVLACPVVVVCCPHPEYKHLEFRPEQKVVDPWGFTKS